jgi:peptide chain release factor
MGPKKAKIKALEKKMSKLGIKKKDIEIQFIKASGKGGQKVNKSSSAVFAKHIGTGLSVKYGKKRSQFLNRFFALRLLVQKIDEQINGLNSMKLSKIEKFKKQKLRRKRKTRQKLAKDK